MKKSSLEDSKHLFLELARAEDQIVKTLEATVQKETVRYSVLQNVKSNVDALVAAFRKSYQGLSQEEKESLVNIFIEKITSHIDSEARASRDGILISKGKISALEDSSRRILDGFQSALDEAARVEEIAEKIVSGEEIPNGRKRKPGTRPERISLIRKAQSSIAAGDSNQPDEN